MTMDITKMVDQIIMQAKENQTEFIIETIQPYCENILQMKINKEELKQILLNGIQKQQPCDDCISRQAVLDNAYAYGNGLEPEGYCVNVEDILALPSVTPQPKVGYWILDETDNSITCNKCNCLIWANDIINGEAYYCPNCGVKME